MVALHTMQLFQQYLEYYNFLGQVSLPISSIYEDLSNFFLLLMIQIQIKGLVIYQRKSSSYKFLGLGWCGR